jgi:hypothetical protein
LLINTIILDVKCPEGLVYKECFNRACEVTCSEIMVDDICPLTQECFPGCYCPDGLVKDGDKCISPPECRDCKLPFYKIIYYFSNLKIIKYISKIMTKSKHKRILFFLLFCEGK